MNRVLFVAIALAGCQPAVDPNQPPRTYEVTRLPLVRLCPDGKSAVYRTREGGRVLHTPLGAYPFRHIDPDINTKDIC